MPLLPPSTALSANAHESETSSVSQEQRRLKFESKLQAIRNVANPEPSISLPVPVAFLRASRMAG
jgi:hypothetical protein